MTSEEEQAALNRALEEWLDDTGKCRQFFGLHRETSVARFSGPAIKRSFKERLQKFTADIRNAFRQLLF